MRPPKIQLFWWCTPRFRLVKKKHSNQQWRWVEPVDHPNSVSGDCFHPAEDKYHWDPHGSSSKVGCERNRIETAEYWSQPPSSDFLVLRSESSQKEPKKEPVSRQCIRIQPPWLWTVLHETVVAWAIFPFSAGHTNMTNMGNCIGRMMEHRILIYLGVSKFAVAPCIAWETVSSLAWGIDFTPSVLVNFNMKNVFGVWSVVCHMRLISGHFGSIPGPASLVFSPAT